VAWAILETDSKAKAVSELQLSIMELHRKYWPGFDGEIREVLPMFDPRSGRSEG